MPIFWTEAVETFVIFKLGRDALTKVIVFVRDSRNTMTRESFMSNKTLYNISYKCLTGLQVVFISYTCFICIGYFFELLSPIWIC